VLIDQEDGIIAGHGRVLAAHLLGLDEVPCIGLSWVGSKTGGAVAIALLCSFAGAFRIALQRIETVSEDVVDVLD
jgi:hypothetical protein